MFTDRHKRTSSPPFHAAAIQTITSIRRVEDTTNMPTSVLSHGPELQTTLAFTWDHERLSAAATTSRLNRHTSRGIPSQSSKAAGLPSVNRMARTPPAETSPNDAFTRPNRSTLPTLKRPKMEDDDSSFYHMDGNNRNRNLSIGELSNSSDTAYSQKPDLIMMIGGPEMRDPSQRTPGNTSSTPGPGPGCTRCSALEPLMQDAARSLTKLAASLRSGLPGSEPLQLDQLGALNQQQCPQVSESGLVHTLQWMLDALENTHLFVSQAVASRSTFIKNEIQQSTSFAPGHNETMKRHMPPIHNGEYKRQLQDTAFRPEIRRASTTDAVGDELPPISSRSPFSSTTIQSPFVPRLGATMNPPPPVGRQLPSPPSRPQQSPPQYNLASPASTYRPASLPPPQPSSTNVPQHHQPLGNPVLNPISPTSSTDPVSQAHSAALQHEISLRTLQLQSLQNEHENLLAAYTRSENRAADLERKHALTDAEMAGLQEERMQLQSKVLELEQNVDDLSKSRNQARQAAVNEGSQYVKIVKMASRLEEIAMKERKSWNHAKAEMEKRISDLESERDEVVVHGGERSTPRAVARPSHETASFDEPSVIRDLRMEIAHLKRCCHEFESALISVRSDSLLIEDSLDTLSEARKRIADRVNRTLEPAATPPVTADSASKDTI